MTKVVNIKDFDEYLDDYQNFTGILLENECKHWLVNGELHREDGPAYEGADGVKAWYRNGLAHREDGPAIILSDGRKIWRIHGKDVTEEEHNQWVRNNKLEKFLDD